MSKKAAKSKTDAPPLPLVAPRGIEYVADRSTPLPDEERRDDDPQYAGVQVHCIRDYLPRCGRPIRKLTDTSWLVAVDDMELVVHDAEEAWG